MPTITDAKRLIALSPEGARLLGAGVYKPCSQQRYSIAALAALNDLQADYTAEERRIISAYIGGDDEDASDTRDRFLHIRISLSEWETLDAAASSAGQTISEYVRRRALG